MLPTLTRCAPLLKMMNSSMNESDCDSLGTSTPEAGRTHRPSRCRRDWSSDAIKDSRLPDEEYNGRPSLSGALVAGGAGLESNKACSQSKARKQHRGLVSCPVRLNHPSMDWKVLNGGPWPQSSRQWAQALPATSTSAPLATSNARCSMCHPSDMAERTDETSEGVQSALAVAASETGMHNTSRLEGTRHDGVAVG